jgi:apolipoprotein N-acyltransferase
MPTAIALLATALFVAYLALWPAVTGYVAVRTRVAFDRASARRSVALDAVRVAAWMALYRDAMARGGLRRVAGQLACRLRPDRRRLSRFVRSRVDGGDGRTDFRCPMLGRCLRIAACAMVCVALYVGGAALARIEWTRQDGTPLTVSLVQGNILQDVKFDPEFREHTFQIYAQMVRQSSGKLIVLPESAYPMFSDEVPDRVLLNLARTGTRAGWRRFCSVCSPPKRRCPARTSRATSTRC